MTEAGSDHTPADALLLALSADSNRGFSDMLLLFPELSPDLLVDKLFLHWRDMADRGAFRDAVNNILNFAPEQVVERALPRLRDIVHSDEYSITARALAYSALENHSGLRPLPQLALELRRQIEIASRSDQQFFQSGAADTTSEHYVDRLCGHPSDETPIQETLYAHVEQFRHHAGVPYGFAYHLAPQVMTPFHDEIVRRLLATGCRTTEYLVRLGLAQLESNEHMQATRPDHDRWASLQANLDTFQLGPNPDTVREEWFTSARFWLSTCDERGNAFLMAWVKTPRPGGNLALLQTGPGGIHRGLCDRSVPEAKVPSERLGGRPVTAIPPHVALTLLRRGLEIREAKHTPEWPRAWPQYGPELDAAAHIEDAAVQMLLATTAQKEETSDEVQHVRCEASLDGLATLLATDAYCDWEPPLRWSVRDSTTMIREGRLSDLRRHALTHLPAAQLGGACRLMAEWHRCNGEHAKAALITAAARDLAQNGEDALIVRALVDHWTRNVADN